MLAALPPAPADRLQVLGGELDGLRLAHLGSDHDAAQQARGCDHPAAGDLRRRGCPGFDDRAVTAAAAGGGTLKLLAHPPCPGNLCGTPTGYDYGCREAACREAKSAKVIAARKRKT
ncbi:hypothetical protein GCM10022221_68420 [Actinocorallia aurea]